MRISHSRFFGAAALLALLGLSQSSAHAQVTGYTLRLSGDFNVPRIRLTNDSGLATITALSLTIGDTTRNFDFAIGESFTSGIAFVQVSPDNGNGGVRSDVVSYTFTGFSPTSFFQFDADVDIDAGNSGEDYRQVLFDLNGTDSSDNSLVTVNFSDGIVLSGNLPDFPTNPNNVFTFSQHTVPSNVIPEPGTVALLTSGLLPLAGAVLRRRRTRA